MNEICETVVVNPDDPCLTDIEKQFYITVPYYSDDSDIEYLEDMEGKRWFEAEEDTPNKKNKSTDKNGVSYTKTGTKCVSIDELTDSSETLNDSNAQESDYDFTNLIRKHRTIAFKSNDKKVDTVVDHERISTNNRHYTSNRVSTASTSNSSVVDSVGSYKKTSTNNRRSTSSIVSTPPNNSPVVNSVGGYERTSTNNSHYISTPPSNSSVGSYDNSRLYCASSSKSRTSQYSTDFSKRNSRNSFNSSTEEDSFFSCTSEDIRTTPYKQSLFHRTEPCYKDYQLLGDSLLVRFSEQLLDYRAYIYRDQDTNKCTRRIGYCVSGQKVKDLHQRLLNDECKLSNRVIMLIGTNDFVQKTELNEMQEAYSSIIEMVKPKIEKLVLLTVPPIPKLQHHFAYWKKLERFNSFVLKQSDNKNIFAVDLASLFISYNNTTSKEYFEEVLYKRDGNKVDLVHLNRTGLKLMRSILNIMYFDQN